MTNKETFDDGMLAYWATRFAALILWNYVNNEEFKKEIGDEIGWETGIKLSRDFFYFLRKEREELEKGE